MRMPACSSPISTGCGTSAKPGGRCCATGFGRSRSWRPARCPSPQRSSASKRLRHPAKRPPPRRRRTRKEEPLPALRRPPEPRSVMLPPRSAAVGGKADVLVVGGGPAGMGAALGAAWVGAKVILVERYGFFGGHATVSLVMPLMSFHTQHRPPKDADQARLLPPDQDRK